MWAGGKCLIISPVVTSSFLIFPQEEIPSLVFPLRASPWQCFANVLVKALPKGGIAQNVARTVPMTHPPTTCDSWLLLNHPHSHSPPHSSPPSPQQLAQKCTILHTTEKPFGIFFQLIRKFNSPSQSYPRPCIYYVRNLDETPRVNLFMSIMFIFGVTK